MEGRRGITLLEHLSVVDGGRQTLEGLLTLDGVIGTKTAERSPEDPPQQHPTEPPAQPPTHLICNRTLLEIIKADDFNKKGRNPWKALKDRLGLIRVLSDNSSHRSNNSVSELTHIMTQDDSPSAGDNTEENSAASYMPNAMRVGSSRFAATRSESTRYGDSFDPDASAVWDRRPVSRHNSSRQLPTSEPQNQKRERRITFRGLDGEGEEENEDQPDSARVSRSSTAEERTMSAREAVAAQEAAEAAAAAAAESEESKDTGGGGMKMSLMDLLEEEGSSYMMGDDDEDCEDEEEEEAEKKEHEVGSVEYNCCICMVRHKGAAFIPCGHAFCRLCSRELYVSRGNCPICNNFIAEILDIF